MNAILAVILSVFSTQSTDLVFITGDTLHIYEPYYHVEDTLLASLNPEIEFPLNEKKVYRLNASSQTPDPSGQNLVILDEIKYYDVAAFHIDVIDQVIVTKHVTPPVYRLLGLVAGGMLGNEVAPFFTSSEFEDDEAVNRKIFTGLGATLGFILGETLDYRSVKNYITVHHVSTMSRGEKLAFLDSMVSKNATYQTVPRK